MGGETKTSKEKRKAQSKKKEVSKPQPATSEISKGKTGAGSIQSDFNAKFNVHRADGIDLDEWDPETLEDNAFVVLYGIRRSGKSVAIKDLMYRRRNKYFGAIVVSATEKWNHWFSGFIPEEHIHHEWSRHIWDKIEQRQEGIDADDPRVKLVLIGDDLQADKKNIRDESIAKAAMRGRHVHILGFWTTQHPTRIQPAVRENADWALIFWTDSPVQKEALWESYGGLVDRNTFYALIDKYTEDNGVLVVHKTEQSVDIKKKYFRWKATFYDEKFKFRFGAPAYWNGSAGPEQAKDLNLMRGSSIVEDWGRQMFQLEVRKVEAALLL